MSRAFAIRRWATWLFFLSSLVALTGAGEANLMLLGQYGRDFPSTLTRRVPIATQYLLQHSWVYTSWMKLTVLGAVLCAVLIFRLSKSREAAYHYLALLTLTVYHLAFMTVLFFSVVFFLLPRVAGI